MVTEHKSKKPVWMKGAKANSVAKYGNESDVSQRLKSSDVATTSSYKRGMRIKDKSHHGFEKCLHLSAVHSKAVINPVVVLHDLSSCCSLVPGTTSLRCVSFPLNMKGDIEGTTSKPTIDLPSVEVSQTSPEGVVMPAVKCDIVHPEIKRIECGGRSLLLERSKDTTQSKSFSVDAQEAFSKDNEKQIPAQKETGVDSLQDSEIDTEADNEVIRSVDCYDLFEKASSSLAPMCDIVREDHDLMANGKDENLISVSSRTREEQEGDQSDADDDDYQTVPLSQVKTFKLEYNAADITVDSKEVMRTAKTKERSKLTGAVYNSNLPDAGDASEQMLVGEQNEIKDGSQKIQIERPDDTKGLTMQISNSKANKLSTVGKEGFAQTVHNTKTSSETTRKQVRAMSVDMAKNMVATKGYKRTRESQLPAFLRKRRKRTQSNNCSVSGQGDKDLSTEKVNQHFSRTLRSQSVSHVKHAEVSSEEDMPDALILAKERRKLVILLECERSQSEETKEKKQEGKTPGLETNTVKKVVDQKRESLPSNEKNKTRSLTDAFKRNECTEGKNKRFFQPQIVADRRKKQSKGKHIVQPTALDLVSINECVTGSDYSKAMRHETSTQKISLLLGQMKQKKISSVSRQVSVGKRTDRQPVLLTEDNQPGVEIKEKLRVNQLNVTKIPQTRLSAASRLHYFDGTISSKKSGKQKLCRNYPSEDNHAKGLRRSRRTRVKPLDWFRNERIHYERRGSGVIAVGIYSPIMESKHGTAKKFCKKMHCKEKHPEKMRHTQRRNLSINTDISQSLLRTQSEVKVLNPLTQEEVFVDCVKTFDKAKLVGLLGKPPNKDEPLLWCKTVHQETFSSGTLIIRPLEIKKMRLVQSGTMLFHIIRGKVGVTIHQTNFVVESRDKFFVPAEVNDINKSLPTLAILWIRQSSRPPALFLTNRTLSPAQTTPV